MDRLLLKLSEVSIGFLFSLPYIYIYFRIYLITKRTSNKSHFVNFLKVVILVNFFFGSGILTFRELTGFTFFIWCLLTIPVFIALLLLVGEITIDTPIEVKTMKIIGLPTKHFISLVVLAIVALTLIISDIYINCPKALISHKAIINKIAESDDPKMILIQETTSPRYMSDILLSDIQSIKDGKATLGIPCPWKVNIIVNSRNVTWTFNYVRDNEKWELEGLKSKSW